MQIIRESNIDFAGKRFPAMAISAIVLLIGIYFIFLHHGLVYSIDFTGGTQLQYRFEEPIPEEDLRGALRDAGFAAEVTSLQDLQGGLPESMIKIQGDQISPEAQAELQGVLQTSFPGNDFELRKIDRIGPRVGEELKWGALKAILISLVLIVFYISIRFEFMYAIGALVALAHDVLVALGVFSILSVEISLPIIAALLTIVGYSLNDTIVVFDRIRENMKRMQGRKTIDIINTSINQTLSRTLLTSLTTFVVVLIMFIFGGETIHNMVFALMLGVLVGTYSSIFVASPVLIEWSARVQAKKALKG